jgi:hypothetical protein
MRSSSFRTGKALARPQLAAMAAAALVWLLARGPAGTALGAADRSDAERRARGAELRSDEPRKPAAAGATASSRSLAEARAAAQRLSADQTPRAGVATPAAEGPAAVARNTSPATAPPAQGYALDAQRKAELRRIFAPLAPRNHPK